MRTIAVVCRNYTEHVKFAISMEPEKWNKTTGVFIKAGCEYWPVTKMDHVRGIYFNGIISLGRVEIELFNAAIRRVMNN